MGCLLSANVESVRTAGIHRALDSESAGEKDIALGELETLADFLVRPLVIVASWFVGRALLELRNQLLVVDQQCRVNRRLARIAGVEERALRALRSREQPLREKLRGPGHRLVPPVLETGRWAILVEWVPFLERADKHLHRIAHPVRLEQQQLASLVVELDRDATPAAGRLAFENE